MSSGNKRLVRGLWQAGLAIGLVVLAVWVWSHRQYIQDWQVVQNYTPTTEIEAIAGRSGLTERGKFLFYTGEPQLSEASKFNSQCQRREESSAILGCYASGRIYLFAITHQDLDGVEEVTAAHEMLHAAWDRLSVRDHKRLGELLEAAYARIKTEELETRMAYYARTEPGQRHNELHSILGTEIADLGPELEAHYQTYFADRQQVVTLYESYASVFRQIERDAKELEQKLTSLSTSINSDIAAYNRDMSQLNAAITAHNDQTATVDRTSASEVNAYNANRARLLARADELSERRRSIEARSQEYDTETERYNQLTLRSRELSASLNSMAPASEEL